MDGLRRSARLARDQTTSTPNFKQQTHGLSRYSSTSTTSYQSPDHAMHPPSLHQSQSQSTLRVSTAAYPAIARGPNPLNAPLPSPSTADINPFFGRAHSQPNLVPQQLHRQQGSFGAPHQTQPNLVSQQNQQHPGTQIPQNQGPLPPDFDVLAEAAKRAQMACLMRDMGDVTL